MAKTRVTTGVVRIREPCPHKKQRVAMNKLVDLIPKGYPGVFDYGVEEVGAMTPKRKRVKRYLPPCEEDVKAETGLRASFGKAAIIRDMAAPELPDEKPLDPSVARAEIEEHFKWLKDRYVVSLKSMWERHDAAIPRHMWS